MRVHSDDRRTFYGNIFPLMGGDVNVAVLMPGAICAWHRHQKQDDEIFCVVGSVKVGVAKGPPPALVTWTVLTDRVPDTLTICRNHWHGYQNIGPERAILVGYNNRKYDGTDEERMTVLDMGHAWERTAR